MDKYSALFALEQKLNKLPKQYSVFYNKPYAKYLFYMSAPKELGLKYAKKMHMQNFSYFWENLSGVLNTEQSLFDIADEWKFNKLSKKRWFHWWNKKINTWTRDVPIWSAFFSLKRLGFNEDLINNAIDSEVQYHNLMQLTELTIKELMKHYSQKKLLYLIFNARENPDFNHQNEILDLIQTIRDFGEYPKMPQKVKTFEQIYALLSHQVELIQRLNQRDRKLSINDNYKNIDNKVIRIMNDEYKIKVPSTLHELISLSFPEHFNNCIGIRPEYELKVENDFLICGLYKNDLPIVCVMLDPIFINNEIKGKNNHYVCDLDRSMIELGLRTFINDNKIKEHKKARLMYQLAMPLLFMVLLFTLSIFSLSLQ